MQDPNPPLDESWVSYAYWENTTGKPITSFKTTWTVPPAPQTQLSQTLFLFNSILNAPPDPSGTLNGILQPVLQWGISAAGGGQYWSIGSWYVDTDSNLQLCPQLTQVEEGQDITGVMTLTGQSDDGFTYTCEFEGYPDSSLTVENIAELKYCSHVLEAFVRSDSKKWELPAIKDCSQYPNTDKTAFSSIEIETGGEIQEVQWTPAIKDPSCGSHAIAVSASEVDIYYRSDPS
ncbi:MAG TPA: hypothetical protein VKU00_20285 [Chthonomonadaceae bacterium]|nr:hypothetical protein [Chthonomonadaceae bacterium]